MEISAKHYFDGVGVDLAGPGGVGCPPPPHPTQPPSRPPQKVEPGYRALEGSKSK